MNWKPFPLKSQVKPSSVDMLAACRLKFQNQRQDRGEEYLGRIPENISCPAFQVDSQRSGKHILQAYSSGSQWRKGFGGSADADLAAQSGYVFHVFCQAVFSTAAQGDKQLRPLR
jgi:hypothetical protein